jgi:hypothetical protein
MANEYYPNETLLYWRETMRKLLWGVGNPLNIKRKSLIDRSGVMPCS